MRKTCSIKNCLKHARGHGMCSAHYTRWRRTGDPQPQLRVLHQTPDVTEYFDARVVKGPESSDCWVWTVGIHTDGYGRASIKGQQWLAHRLSYELHVGLIPEGMVLDHTCMNRPCVNPEHLQVLTARANTQLGSLRRGRITRPLDRLRLNGEVRKEMFWAVN